MVTNTQGLTNARLGLCFPSISVLNLCIFRESETHNLEASWRCAHPNHPGQEHPNTRTSCMHTKLTLSPSHLLILIRLLLKNIFLKIKWILFPIVSTFSYKETTPFFLIFETNLQKKKIRSTHLFWFKCISSTETVSCLLDELPLQQTTPVYSQISWGRRASLLIPQSLRGHNIIPLTWQVLRKCFLIVGRAAL